ACSGRAAGRGHGAAAGAAAGPGRRRIVDADGRAAAAGRRQDAGSSGPRRALPQPVPARRRAPASIVTPMAPATVTSIAPDDRRVSRMPGTVRESKMRMPVPAAPGLSLAIASPKGGVGKTTISLNLGISLAHRGLRVIVIDGDINGDLLSLINQRSVV